MKSVNDTVVTVRPEDLGMYRNILCASLALVEHIAQSDYTGRNGDKLVYCKQFEDFLRAFKAPAKQ